MSLLRLLTAGKSLVGLKDHHSRYMTRGVALPKFGSKKNPFRATTKTEVAVQAESTRASGPFAPQSPLGVVGTGVRSGGADTVLKTGSEKPVADSGASVGSPAPVEAEVPHPPNPATGGSKAMVPRAEGYFTLTKLLFWQRPKADRQGPPPLIKPMVQGQLSLEAVKVIRNDLSDTDLEIVAAKPPVTGPTEAPTVSRFAKASSSETAWGRVTARIFGGGKV